MTSKLKIIKNKKIKIKSQLNKHRFSLINNKIINKINKINNKYSKAHQILIKAKVFKCLDIIITNKQLLVQDRIQ